MPSVVGHWDETADWWNSWHGAVCWAGNSLCFDQQHVHAFEVDWRTFQPEETKRWPWPICVTRSLESQSLDSTCNLLHTWQFGWRYTTSPRVCFLFALTNLNLWLLLADRRMQSTLAQKHKKVWSHLSRWQRFTSEIIVLCNRVGVCDFICKATSTPNRCTQDVSACAILYFIKD